MVYGDNTITWEAYTSRKAVSFNLMNEGLEVKAFDMGLQAQFDWRGQLECVRVNVLELVTGMLKDEDIVESFDMTDKMVELLGKLEDYKGKFVADFNLIDNMGSVLDVDKKTDEEKMIIMDKKKDPDSPLVMMITFDDLVFGLMFQKFDDDFAAGIGFVESKEIQKPSDIGSLPGEEFQKTPEEKKAEREADDGSFHTSFIVRFVADEVNYLTYLESTKPDRFEKLSKRIFPD